jgi:hypothetical protein
MGLDFGRVDVPSKKQGRDQQSEKSDGQKRVA